jgi:F-type H+-transporting ATPase subunit b
MPQLDFANYPFLSQIFWLALSFALLYYFAAKYILPRISKIIEMRESKISQAISEAEKIKAQAENYLNSNKSILNEAKEESYRLIAETQSKIDKKLKSETEKLDIKLNEKLALSNSEISSLKQTLKKEISKAAADISNKLVKNYL